MLIAVKEKQRKKGYGKKLLKKIISNLEKMGINKIYLEVRISNLIAINLYKENGFVIEGIRKKYYDNNEDAYIMKREVK